MTRIHSLAIMSALLGSIGLTPNDPASLEGYPSLTIATSPQSEEVMQTQPCIHCCMPYCVDTDDAAPAQSVLDSTAR